MHLESADDLLEFDINAAAFLDRIPIELQSPAYRLDARWIVPETLAVFFRRIVVVPGPDTLVVEPLPGERGPGIHLAVGRDIRVTHDVDRVEVRVPVENVARKEHQQVDLRFVEGPKVAGVFRPSQFPGARVVALASGGVDQLDAYRTVIERFLVAPRALTRVPGVPVLGNQAVNM